MLTMLSPVQDAIDRVAHGSTGLVRDYIDLVNVRRDNERLKAELAELKTNQSRLVELETENRHLAELLDLRDVLGGNSIAANVIGSDANGLARTLVISQGASSGLRPGMAVLSFQGVVGKVIAVSPHAARVLIIDDHNSALDSFDQRTRARGIVAGVVDDGLTMKYVERSQDVRPGRRHRDLGAGWHLSARIAHRHDQECERRGTRDVPQRDDHPGGGFSRPRAGAGGDANARAAGQQPTGRPKASELYEW